MRCERDATAVSALLSTATAAGVDRDDGIAGEEAGGTPSPSPRASPRFFIEKVPS
jgi:hypothetical protein